ncbi:MAG: arylsulfatase, partial [Planctomycetes bacterium]|nr:arylsulfatase [Planctomycetota bacterium]
VRSAARQVADVPAFDGQADAPNIILIMTDDQGYGDLGVHGNTKIKTPNLDRFAKESLEMTRFYVNPLCSPTRSSLMTGRYHLRTGVLHTSRGAAKMSGNEVTIAELLAQAGYQTGIFGKWHIGDNYPMRPQDQGFGEVLVHRSGGIGQPPDNDATYFKPVLWHNGKRTVHDGYCTDVFFDGAIRFIEKNRHCPFFIYLPTNVPHGPHHVSEKYSGPFKAMGLDDKTANYYGMIANFDENFGRLAGRLDAVGLRKNTMLIFMTDNGSSAGFYNAGLRGSKGSVYEGGIRVPFFVRWPKRLRSGWKTDRIAANIDILPTLLATAGGSKPDDLTLDGTDLLPLWTEQIKPQNWPDRTLFVQHIKAMIQQPFQNAAAYSQRYKMVAYPETAKQSSFDPDHDRLELELYDIEKDPSETKDLASIRPNVLADLRRQYERWFRQMKNTRNFQPGLIHIGSAQENPTYLCRYQDASYPYSDSYPIGWPVKVVRDGVYRFTIVRPDHDGAGALAVRWQDKTTRRPLEPGEHHAKLKLAKGQGILEVWIELNGKGRIKIKDRTTNGDIIVESQQN